MPCCSSPAKLSSPYSAVATLLLIENSSSMSTVWRILRDRYLPSVLRKLLGTNSNASSSTFFIESSSLSPGITAGYKLFQDGSCGLEFASDANSRLSAEKIHSSIDLLNTIKIQTQPIALHLIIVAASAPLSNYQNANPNHLTIRSTWLHLAERMTQESIQCHLVLKTDQDVSPFEVLFEETLRLRTSREAPLSFNAPPTEVIIRLAETNDFAANAYCQRSHHRLPLEPSNGKSYDTHYKSSSQTQSEMPSLVSQLQQKHGLTKKKVYGVKLPRQPFFRDDPPSDPYRRPAYPLPPSLADLSLTTPVVMTPGGRSAPLSRLDRLTRVTNRGSTDASRRWHPPTPKTSSDVDFSVVSSGIPPNTPPAVHERQHTIPTSAEIAYQAPTHLDKNGFYRSTNYESSIDSQWGTDPSGSMPQNTPATIAQMPQAAYIQNAAANVYGHLQTPGSVDSQPTSQSPSLDHKPLGSACDELNYNAPAPPSSSTSSPSPHAGSTTKDDEPFTFPPAFVAATTVMFQQEVLPAYPELVDSYASSSESTKRRIDGEAQEYNTGCDHSILSYLPYLPASKAGQLYATKYGVAACQQQASSDGSWTTSENTTTVNAESLYYQYPAYSVGTSSLTGWAG